MRADRRESVFFAAILFGGLKCPLRSFCVINRAPLAKNVKDREGEFPKRVSLIGGGSRSRRWAEILASVLQRPLLRHADSELGPAFGAARLAMLAVTGRSPTEICQRPPVSEVIKPRTEHLEAYQRQFARFQSLYGKLEPEFQGGAAMGG